VSRPAQLAFVTTTAEAVAQIRLWMQYHRAIGVSRFYLFVEGQAARPQAVADLRSQPGVTVVERTPELLARQAASRTWNETWLAAFFHKPCNHELFVKQSLNIEGARRLRPMCPLPLSSPRKPSRTIASASRPVGTRC
jgi:hypothetical protein